MNLQQQAIIFAIVMAVGTTAIAGEVYKSVDSKGGVEFSDKPSPGAKEVDVRPNVVDVTPAKPHAPSAPAVSNRRADAAGGNARPKAILEDESSGYNGRNYYGNERRRDVRKQIERGSKPTQLPAHKGLGSGKSSAQGGGRGR